MSLDEADNKKNVIMDVIYDKWERCLLCYGKNPNPSFWDNHWTDADISETYKSLSRYNLVKRVTKKYLQPKDGPVLEGGCGVGQFVYCLSEAGYESIGIDSAKETVAKVKRAHPTLNVTVMDVRKLEFPDDYFAGYWSLGLIEHFYEGYEDVLSEMYRVLRPGGYVFVTVPVMSLLRRLKAALGFYKQICGNRPNRVNDAEFYQFILRRGSVINSFVKRGLRFLYMRQKFGIKGLADEVSILRVPLMNLVELRSRNVIIKGFVKLIDIILSPLTGHTGFFVFRKAR
jgi:SAM-dependent methyltransferase